MFVYTEIYVRLMVHYQRNSWGRGKGVSEGRLSAFRGSKTKITVERGWRGSKRGQKGVKGGVREGLKGGKARSGGSLMD